MLKNLKWLFLAIVTLITISSMATAEAPIYEPKTPEEYILMYAQKYDINESMFLKVAVCESSLNPDAIHYHDGGKGKHSVGVFQFQESTFLTWEKIFGEDLDYYSYHDQIKLAAFMFSEKQQSQWSCTKIVSGVK
jgi:hypothetical protein